MPETGKGCKRHAIALPVLTKIKKMTHTEIIADLKSRGEHSIRFMEDGSILSHHGQNTTNYWCVSSDNKLICYHCKTSY